MEDHSNLPKTKHIAITLFGRFRYEAYYDLKLQLSTNDLVRDYLVLCHGWMSTSSCVINERVHWMRKSSVPSTVNRQGLPIAPPPLGKSS